MRWFGQHKYKVIKIGNETDGEQSGRLGRVNDVTNASPPAA